MKVNKINFIKGIAIGTITVTGIMNLISNKILKKALYPETVNYYDAYKKELLKNNFDEEKFHKVKKEEFYLSSKYGYDIHGFLFPNENSKKTVIIIHGINMSLWSSLRYKEIFMKKGYNVVVYDQRNHGLSGGEFSTMGLYERHDTVKIIDYVKKVIGEDSIIGIHGESMGAGTAMLLLDIEDRINFLIEDCGYTTILDEFKVRLKEEYGLPVFPFISIANRSARIRLGIDFKKNSPIECVRNSDIPILFIHGDNDKYVPTNMVYKLYESKKNNKEIKIFKDTKHAQSVDNYPKEYQECIYEFLDKYNF